MDEDVAVNEVDRVGERERRGIAAEVGLRLAAARAGREVGREAEAYMIFKVGEEVDIAQCTIRLILLIFECAGRLVAAGGHPGVEA